MAYVGGLGSGLFLLLLIICIALVATSIAAQSRYNGLVFCLGLIASFFILVLLLAIPDGFADIELDGAVLYDALHQYSTVLCIIYVIALAYGVILHCYYFAMRPIQGRRIQHVQKTYKTR